MLMGKAHKLVHWTPFVFLMGSPYPISTLPCFWVGVKTKRFRVKFELCPKSIQTAFWMFKGGTAAVHARWITDRAGGIISPIRISFTFLKVGGGAGRWRDEKQKELIAGHRIYFWMLGLQLKISLCIGSVLNFISIMPSRKVLFCCGLLGRTNLISIFENSWVLVSFCLLLSHHVGRRGRACVFPLLSFFDCGEREKVKFWALHSFLESDRCLGRWIDTVEFCKHDTKLCHSKMTYYPVPLTLNSIEKPLMSVNNTRAVLNYFKHCRDRLKSLYVVWWKLFLPLLS